MSFRVKTSSDYDAKQTRFQMLAVNELTPTVVGCNMGGILAF